MSILTELVSKGYFPKEVPPAFSTESLAPHAQDIVSDHPDFKTKSTTADLFSIARTSLSRRVTTAPSPLQYILQSACIAENWDQIKAHFLKSTISISIPEFNNGIRAISFSSFKELDNKNTLRGSGYKYCLKTDISRFFPSIYTHSFSWALHGKPAAKAALKRKKKNRPKYFGDDLDDTTRRLQDNQTIGILVGPDTSHILSEIIGVALDEKIQNQLKKEDTAIRYVDDYFIYTNSQYEAERILTIIKKALAEFELDINPIKTSIVPTKDLYTSNWAPTIRKHKISSIAVEQRFDIASFFQTAFKIADETNEESVIKYALKIISATIIKKQNWKYFEVFLLRCAMFFPNCIQDCVTILSTYNQHGYPISKDSITRFLTSLSSHHSKLDNHSETAWLLWLAKELNITCEENTLERAARSRSSFCRLLGYDLLKSQYPGNNFDLKKEWINEDQIENGNWLSAYEAVAQGWIKDKHLDVFYLKLFDKKVSFYDPTAHCTPLFTLDDNSVFINDEEPTDVAFISPYSSYESLLQRLFEEEETEENTAAT